jgi:uncharacterized DUF497 family protein
VGSRVGPPEFEWDDVNENHLWDRHKVSVWEAEQCFNDAKASRRRIGDDIGMLASTDDRMLFLIYQQKTNGTVRVYGARDMIDREKRKYRKGRQ